MNELDGLKSRITERHQAAHMTMPDDGQWISGLPMGNGDIGAMAWGGGSPLNFTLDKSDLWDTRMEWPDEDNLDYQTMLQCASEGDWERFQWLFEDSIRAVNPLGPTKVYFGRLEIDIPQTQGNATGRLQFYDGVAEIEIPAGPDSSPCTCFVHHEMNVVCIRLEPWPEGVEISVRGLAETNEALADLDSFSPVQVTTDTRMGLTQQVPEGPAAAAVWTNPENCCLYLALESDADTALALARADATATQAREIGWDGLLHSHRQAWHSFWETSGIHVPHAVVDYHWHLGMYLANSSMRQGCLPPGLQGLWALDGEAPPWHGDYHADMNIQETFWPVYANNHPELGRSLTDFLSDCLPRAQEFCRKFFGWEGAFFPTAFVPGMTFVPGWSTAQFWMGVPGWLAQHMWLQWQYGRDEKRLREQILPFLRSVLQFYDGLLEDDDEGTLHVPLSTSPEIGNNRPEAWCRDPNCDLSIIRNLCRWVIETEKAADELQMTDRAKDISAHLAGYAINEEGGLMLWPGREYDESHRHPSHLMGVHPLDDITVEGGEEQRRIIERSMWELLERGMGRWAGHTYPQSLALAARAGNGNMAAHQVHIFDETFTWANGLHLNGDFRQTGMSIFATEVFCMEANCGIAGTIPEMLLQSWHERIRVFPALPDDWHDLAFYRLRAEGGLIVSAEYRGDKTRFVWIEATTPCTCRLLNPFDGDWSCSHDVSVEGEDIVVPMDPGQTVAFQRKT